MAGETSAAACVREAAEEVGVAVGECELTFIGRTVHNNNIHDYYAMRNDLPIEQFVFPVDEISALRWISLEGIRDLLRQELFLLADISDLDTLEKYICENIKG